MALPSIVRLRLALGQRLLRWGALLAGGPAPAAEAGEPPPELDAAPDAHRQWLDRVAHLPPEAWQGSQPGRAPVPRRRPALRPAPGPVGVEAAPPRLEADATLAAVRPVAAPLPFFDRSRRAMPARPVAGGVGSVAAPRRVPVASFEAPTARPAPRPAGVPTAPSVPVQRLVAGPVSDSAASRLRPTPVPPRASAPRPITPFRAAQGAAVGPDPRPAAAASASARQRSEPRTPDSPATLPAAPRRLLRPVADAIAAPPPRRASPPATDRPPPAARRAAFWSEPDETGWPELPPLAWGHEPASTGDEVRLAQRRERLAAEQRG